jgi:restriction endonuclease S subunit
MRAARFTEAIAPMKRRIADIADVRAGYPFRGRVIPDPGGNARVIQIRDLETGGRIRIDQLVRVKAANVENYRLREGDVLFLARGERRFAIPVPEESGNDFIAASYFFVLRPMPEIFAGYMTWAVNQPDFQEDMRTFVKGGTLPQITKTDLLELQIEVPPLATQHQIVAVHALMERERQLCDALNEKRSALLRAIASTKNHPSRKASS